MRKVPPGSQTTSGLWGLFASRNGQGFNGTRSKVSSNVDRDYLVPDSKPRKRFADSQYYRPSYPQSLANLDRNVASQIDDVPDRCQAWWSLVTGEEGITQISMEFASRPDQLIPIQDLGLM